MRPRFSAALLSCCLAFGALMAGSVSGAELAVFKLTARDGRFDPPVLEVPAGQAFTIEVTNENPKAIEFESKELRQEKVIPAGKKAAVTIKALKAGEYRYFDEFNEATGQGKIVAK